MPQIRHIPNLPALILGLGFCALVTSCDDASVAAATGAADTGTADSGTADTGTAAESAGMPQPTAEHKELLKGVGSWEGTLTMYTPDQPESSIPAQEDVVAVGGFWTHSRFTCDFMGQPYVGTGSVGYDPVTKKYAGTWVDSMTSYLAIMTGHKDAKTDAVVMHWDAPNEQGVMTKHRSETVRSDDSYTITFYAGDGAGRKIMVIAMKRKKS